MCSFADNIVVDYDDFNETIIGECSDKSSNDDLSLIKCLGNPFVTQKSITSGNLIMSIGQYVGSPVNNMVILFSVTL